VSVGRQEHDPQVFWLSVLDSLRQTGVGSERVRELTAAPHLDGANVVGRPPSLELADRFGVPRRA